MFLYDKLPEFVIELEFQNASYINRGRDTKINVNYHMLDNENNSKILALLTKNNIFKGRELKLIDVYFAEEKYIRFTKQKFLTYIEIFDYICEFQKEIRSLLKNQHMPYNNHRIKPNIYLQMNEIIIFNWESEII